MVRVAIVEDVTGIREGLRFLIENTEGFSVIAAWKSMEEAICQIASHPIDVMLVDLGLPGISGIEGIQRLKHTHPHIHFLVLTVYDDDSRIFDALCAGACGYLTKKTPPVRLLRAIEDVAGGGAAMSPDIARKVLDAFRRAPAPNEGQCALTPHEIRILKLLMEGRNRKSAADCLGVSMHTVSFHVRQIYEKLQVHTRSAAVAKALRLRLLE